MGTIAAARSIVKRMIVQMCGQMVCRRSRCLFVLSTGRVGTMTITNLLALSREVDAWHEPYPELLTESQQAFLDVWDKRSAYAKVFRDAKFRGLAFAYLRNRIYVETSNRLTFLAPAISDLLPRARFLHLYRHPTQVIRSGMRRDWYTGTRLWDPYRIRPGERDAAYEEWEEWDPFAKVCWNWAAITRFALEFGAVIEAERFLSMKSEDLFDKKTGAYAQVFEFLGLEPPPTHSVDNILSQKYNQQTDGNFPFHSEWSPRQRGIYSRLVGPTAERLGYDLWDESGRPRESEAVQ